MSSIGSSGSKTAPEEYNCYACDGPDSLDDMVQCDVCAAWCHYTCAGVTSTIATEEWSCTNCVQGKIFTSSKSPKVISVAAVNVAITSKEGATTSNAIANANSSQRVTSKFNDKNNNSSQIVARANSLLNHNMFNKIKPATETQHPHVCSHLNDSFLQQAPHSDLGIGNKNSVDTEIVTNVISTVTRCTTSSTVASCATTTTCASTKNVTNNPPVLPAHKSTISRSSEPKAPTISWSNPYGRAWADPSSEFAQMNVTATRHSRHIVNETSLGVSTNPCKENSADSRALSSLSTNPHAQPNVPSRTVGPAESSNSYTTNVPMPVLSSTKLHQTDTPTDLVFPVSKSWVPPACSRSSKSSHTRQIQIELQRINEERELKEKRDEEYLNKKYQLLSQLSDHSSEEDYNSSNASVKVNSWLEYNDSAKGLITKPLSKASNALPTRNRSEQNVLPDGNSNVFKSGKPPHLPSFNAHIMPSFQPQLPKSFVQPKFDVHSTSMPPQPIRKQLAEDLSQQPLVNPHETTFQRLSRSQVAARQLMSRDLQSFTGNAEEWPVFISNFVRSTNLCGFNEEENLMRLQKALKGDALNAVRSILVQPQCVDQIIRTLRTKFGRPEVIIQAVLQKIQTTPAPKEGDFESIIDFSIEVQNYCATIEASGLTIYLHNPTLLQELENKLPHDIRLNWATYKHMLPECSLYHFNEWMVRLADAASCVVPPITRSVGAVPKTRNSRNAKTKGFINAHFDEKNDNIEALKRTSSACCICKSNCDRVENCKKFQSVNRTLKWSLVREHKLCRRCLGQHAPNMCRLSSPCGIGGCPFKHHRLLHADFKHEVKTEKVNASVSVHQHYSERDNATLFRMVPVTLYGDNVEINIFAFIDDGSSVTLLDEDIASQLNLKGKAQPLCLKWTGDTSRYEKESKIVSLQISGINKEKYQLNEVHTVKSLRLPKQSLNAEMLKDRYEHLKGLAIESYTDVTPRLLIGLNNCKLGLPLSSREGSVDEPIATRTRLGWIVHGNCYQGLQVPKQTKVRHNFHMCECNTEHLQRLISHFIINDNFGVAGSENQPLSTEDQRALELLNTFTIKRNGRFETALLWKFDDIQLPSSYSMARKRLNCLHKRMKKEPDLAIAMTRKIEEYITKGYARKLSMKEVSTSNNRHWYLPIFPVFNPNKPGKLRIVWDAAAKVQGVSLNSFLLKGPDQLTSLISVLFKFREEKIAICGDIMEMFHQIQIRAEDQDFQRFLWSRNSDEPPDVYTMQVMTFGASCSPCCAQFVKNKNADEFITEFPRAVRSIKQNHYVDDLMDSTTSEEEAIELALQIRHIHQQGGFYIRNWISNSPAVLKALNSLPTENKDLNVDVELTTEKVLGMWWCTSLDCFTYRLTSNIRQREILFSGCRPTKREVLKVLMTIFDPLGLLAHFLMYVKVLLQDVWRSQIDWDSQIRDPEFQKWSKWVNLLPAVEKLKIPRWYKSRTSKPTEHQLHVFVDASDNGFAAVAYIRTSDDTGQAECALIGAKTRVAPLKSLSIPRLELQAAVLGARFATNIMKSHNLTFDKRFFWSDSKNVLSWLRSDHRRYRQFVAFRVSEILDTTELNEWNWVPTKLNVADEGTKWNKIPEFSADSRWFNGPTFLKLSRENWPQEVCNDDSTAEELKTYYMNLHTKQSESVLRMSEVPSWNRLLRSTAYVLRFMNKIKKKIKKEDSDTPTHHGVLKCEELQRALCFLMREVQRDVYKEELADLFANRVIDKGSPIYNLCPYLDEDKVMRIKGRIDLSPRTDEYFKRPIILPRDHQITNLILLDKHIRYHHQNHETAINDLRQTFYIPRLRAAFKGVRNRCQDCKNKKAQPREPMMAQLPPARLASFSRPFSYTGIDYFGPLNVSVLRRTEKRWGVLLTCLTTRAVHIEIAHSLTADSCILALRNFVARRGTPNEIFSDNGTNFQGAERELREALKHLNKDKLMEAFISPVTKWNFIPPGSPHMGGAWERLVRSIKNVLYKITPTRTPSDELLRSMMMEVENIINSRPLTYVPIEDECEEALTPNHFLLGSSNGIKPAVIFDDNVKVLRKNWLASQRYADHFWRRWVSEYLPSLTRRTKWFTSTKPIEVGDIVLIVDPNNPRNCWQKGRVIETKTASDGQVRSASVQTSTGVYIRPAVRLAVLDVIRPIPKAQ